VLPSDLASHKPGDLSLTKTPQGVLGGDMESYRNHSFDQLERQPEHKEISNPSLPLRT